MKNYSENKMRHICSLKFCAHVAFLLIIKFIFQNSPICDIFLKKSDNNQKNKSRAFYLRKIQTHAKNNLPSRNLDLIYILPPWRQVVNFESPRL